MLRPGETPTGVGDSGSGGVGDGRVGGGEGKGPFSEAGILGDYPGKTRGVGG